MSILNKLLGAWVVNKTVSATTPLLIRLLMGVAAISLVTIFTAFLAALVSVAAIWLAYHELVIQGMTPANAVFTIGIFLLAFLFALAMTIQYYWRKVTHTFREIVYMQSPVGGRMSSLVDSFISGFHSRDFTR